MRLDLHLQCIKLRFQIQSFQFFRLKNTCPPLFEKINALIYRHLQQHKKHSRSGSPHIIPCKVDPSSPDQCNVFNPYTQKCKSNSPWDEDKQRRSDPNPCVFCILFSFPDCHHHPMSWFEDTCCEEYCDQQHLQRKLADFPGREEHLQ